MTATPPANWPVHARFDGPIVMVGYGSIGRGTLPLILRHIACDRSQITVIDPDDSHREMLDAEGIAFVNEAVTRENFRDLLTPLLTKGPGRAFVVNLSVDVSSVAMVDLCKDLDALYVDTVVEPWLGYYTDKDLTIEQRSNYALRESMLALRRKRPGGPTAVSCCGANPGMVSWFVKQALLNLAADMGRKVETPDRPRRLGAPDARSRRQGHPYRRARHPARPDPEAARHSSSTPGRSKASFPRGSSPPSSAGAPTRSRCRRKAAATRTAAARPST